MPLNHSIDVQDVPILSEAKIYPNPFNDKLNIEIGETDNLTDGIKVYDILGKEVDIRITNLNSREIEVSFDSIHDGIYFLKLIGKKSSETFMIYSFRK